MLLAAIVFAGFSFLSGCGARHPIADRKPRAPAAPAPASEERAEAAKRATEVPLAETPRAAPSARLAKPKPAPAASARAAAFQQEGNASWYGVPFHGRHASNGEIYDMYKLTAAHRTLPFDTMLRVTNLANGRSTVVRITDRGPFVENRIIDLSLAAARELDMAGAGIAMVRLEQLSGADPESGFFTVQVGAFRGQANAARLRERLNGIYSPVFVQSFESPDGTFYRVRVGKTATEDAARQLGETLRAREGFTPFVVRLDDAGGGGENP